MKSVGDMAQLLNDAISAHNQGALGLAVGLYEDILTHNPQNVTALNLLGVLKGQMALPEQGVAWLEKALAVDPESGDANANMGLMLNDLGRHGQAIGYLMKAIEKHPDNPNYMLNLAFVLVSFERPEEAIEVANVVIDLHPQLRRAYHAKGNALLLNGHVSEALECYLIALAEHVGDQRIWSNLGLTYRWSRMFPEAVKCHDTAVTLDPESMDARWERALTLLSFGEFETGWKDYAHAKKERGLTSRPGLGSSWDGIADLTNKTIFVYREQGLGDTLQFCRFMKYLPRNGVRVLFAPHAPLKWLMRTMGDDFEICDFSDPDLRADYHVPLVSLPAYFHSQEPQSETPYLFPSQEHVLKWKIRLGSDGFRIGVCWQGSTGKADRGRSFPVRHFEGLSRIPGVRLISLHKGDGEGQLQSLPPGMNIETLGGDFDSGADGFLDSAAVIRSLDLVITSDTAVAHLAGALAAPVWVALKSMPDWRWRLEGEDSPWYPTMRLFRQRTAGDWNGVFAQMEQALRNVFSLQPRRNDGSPIGC